MENVCLESKSRGLPFHKVQVDSSMPTTGNRGNLLANKTIARRFFFSAAPYTSLQLATVTAPANTRQPVREYTFFPINKGYQGVCLSV